MKFFYLLLILSFSVVICAESEETSRYSRYEGACPGNIEDSSKSFGSFVQKYFNNSETTILNTCLPEYFRNYTNLQLGEVEICVVCMPFLLLMRRNRSRSLCGIVANGDCCTPWL